MSARLDGTCVIMDNLLLGGSSDEEHLRNLEAVFVQFNGNVGCIDQLHTQRSLIPNTSSLAPNLRTGRRAMKKPFVL